MFCGKCGSEIPEGANVCPNCGTEVAPATNSAPASGSAPDMEKIALLVGMISLFMSTLGALLWGTPMALVALAGGIVGLVMSINVKKQSNDAKGQAAFTLSLLAVVFGAIMAVGCVICGVISCGAGCYGCLGTKCVADQAARELERELNDLYKSLY